MIDGFQTGDMVEMKWKQRSLREETSDRTLHMILTAPLLTNIGTMQQRIEGWKCHVVYDSHEKRKKIPHDKYYDMIDPNMIAKDDVFDDDKINLLLQKYIINFDTLTIKYVYYKQLMFEVVSWIILIIAI